MAIESKLLPTSPWKGLYVDGMTVPGGLSQAENIEILSNGWAKRRAPTRTLEDTVTVKASSGLKELTEFRNSAGTRYLFADVNISSTMQIISADVTGTTDYEAGTWATAITGLTAGTAILPQYAVMQDRLYRVDGTNSQYVFTTNSAYSAMGVAAPSAAPTVAETTGGSLTLLGEYKLYYTYVRKGTGYEVESDPSPVATVTLTGSNNAINITIVSSSDTSVTHVRLYRTLYGTPLGYAYYDKEIAKATYVATPIQTFTTADASMSTTAIETDNDVPPTAIGLAVAGNRMFYLTKTAVYWSKIEEPEHVPPTWYSAIDPNDGDGGMAICAMQNYVLAFKRKKTFMYDANSAEVVDNTVGIARHILSTRIGCIAQNSVQSCGEQNCIVWLSDEGVMKWQGGEITNISKDRVNSIIDDIMGTANSEYFVDSAYYGKKYHLLLVERNAGLTEISDQRHLVYNFETDSWTEYKHYAADNTTRYYETNLAVTTDSNKKDVFLSTILRTVNATSAYIYQNTYSAASSESNNEEILDATGTGGTAFNAPWWCFTDSSDNFYVISSNPVVVFKVTSAGVKSVLVSNATLRTAAGTDPSLTTSTNDGFINDATNSCFYIIFSTYAGTTSDSITNLIKITYAGVCTLVVGATLVRDPGWVGDVIQSDLELNSDGTTLYYIMRTYSGASVWTSKLRKITDPGGAGQVDAAYYTFPYQLISGGNGLDIYGSDLYFLHYKSGQYVYVTKFTDLTGTANPSVIDTGILASTLPSHLMVISATEMYMRYTGYVDRIYYAGSSWSTVHVASVSGDSGFKTFYKNTAGSFVVSYSSSVDIYDPSWNLTSTISLAGITTATGVAHLIGTTADENTLFICGYGSDNVYKVYPDGQWETVTDSVLDSFWDSESYSDTTMDINGVLGRIVSNYDDLTIPNHKRVNRAYLDVMSEYATCGVFAIESDYTSNRSMHSDDETTEPSSSVSRAPFATGGEQTWNTNSSFNSGNVENWETSRLDVGVSGRKFRYSIKFGDVPDADEGTMYIKPPQFLAQILGNY